MLTIFTIPKPFLGHNGVIQKNAIKSWVHFLPECEVILMGDDDGVEQIAKEFNLKHIPNVNKNVQGTPMLDSAFELAQKEASNEYLVYVNADIIFTHSLVDSFNKIEMDLFFVCGRRWDLDIVDEIDFSKPACLENLIELVESDGVLHGISGMDYFIFRKGTVEMKPFAVGRPCWDSWFLYYIKSRKIPIIDATTSILAIHQNHDYSHSKFGHQKRVAGPEWKKNIEVAGGYTNLLTMRSVDLQLNSDKVVKLPIKSRIISYLTSAYVFRVCLGFKRNIQTSIGMRISG